MKNFFLLVLLIPVFMYSQIGINNTDPRATMEITAKTTNGSKPEGLIVPRLTGNQIRSANAQYLAAQTGTIIYATAADTAPAGKTANITSAGYYYYDGNIWQKVLTESTGDTTNDAWANDNSNSMVKLGAQSDGSTARASGTEFVIKDNGVVGIGTSNPDLSAALDITSTNKGFLPPRIALNSKTDITTISSPTEGLLIYNTGLGSLKSTGLFYWNGFEWVAMKSDGGTSAPGDLNIGETRTAVITVPTLSFMPGSLGNYRTWMNGRNVNNTVNANFKFLSDAAGSTNQFVKFGPNGAILMDFSSGGWVNNNLPSPKFVNTSSSPIFYSLNALSTNDANMKYGTGMWLAPGAVCVSVDGDDGFGFTTNGFSEYVNANILIHDTTDGSVRFYIGTWSLMSADDGLGHNNTYGLFTITRYK